MRSLGRRSVLSAISSFIEWHNCIKVINDVGTKVEGREMYHFPRSDGRHRKEKDSKELCYGKDDSVRNGVSSHYSVPLEKCFLEGFVYIYPISYRCET